MLPLLATVVVFMFHRVAGDVPRNPIALGLTVPTARFARELDALQRAHVKTYTAADVARAYAEGRRLDGVVLSFDDGREDGYSVVFPLLRKHGMVGTFYVNSGTIDGAFHMTWRQLRTMRAAGMEIGCHGAHHLDLTTLSLAGQRAEIGDCLDKVAAHAGARPVTYAYASGKYDRTSMRLLRRLGVVAAVTEHPGTVGPEDDPLQWRRERVARDERSTTFGAVAALARR